MPPKEQLRRFPEKNLPCVDAAGELFRNIVRTSEGPLNSPILILLANYFLIIPLHPRYQALPGIG